MTARKRLGRRMSPLVQRSTSANITYYVERDHVADDQHVWLDVCRITPILARDDKRFVRYVVTVNITGVGRVGERSLQRRASTDRGALPLRTLAGIAHEFID